MSINASVQQMSIGLSAIVAGEIVGKGRDGRLTGYGLAGIIAVICTAASMLLASHLRVPPGGSRNVARGQLLDETPAEATAELVEAAPFANGEPVREIESDSSGALPPRTLPATRDKKAFKGSQGFRRDRQRPRDLGGNA